MIPAYFARVAEVSERGLRVAYMPALSPRVVGVAGRTVFSMVGPSNSRRG